MTVTAPFEPLKSCHGKMSDKLLETKLKMTSLSFPFESKIVSRVKVRVEVSAAMATS